MSGGAIRTKRLLLREWRDDDLAPFWAMSADPEVMRHLWPVADRAASDAAAAAIRGHFARHGFGFRAVELPGVAPFIGFVGLAVVGFDAPFTPAVEIGWRLAREHWGRGYATEAAAAALDEGFGRLGLAEIVAYTVPANRRSERVMQRLGMRRAAAEDFEHPRAPPGHPLRRHVLYRLRREEWRGMAQAARA
jgi:ribosomal-protein-alanine N-acetyltransferase